MQVKKQQLEADMEQQTGSKLGKKYIKAVYCHPVYLTYIQSTSCEIPSWMKHRLMPGASVRNSACGKGHEEGSSAYTKAG